jgi:hypothetical protein
VHVNSYLFSPFNNHLCAQPIIKNAFVFLFSSSNKNYGKTFAVLSKNNKKCRSLIYQVIIMYASELFCFCSLSQALLVLTDMCRWWLFLCCCYVNWGVRDQNSKRLNGFLKPARLQNSHVPYNLEKRLNGFPKTSQTIKHLKNVLRVSDQRIMTVRNIHFRKARPRGAAAWYDGAHVWHSNSPP